jgi:hypothetical protein
MLKKSVIQLLVCFVFLFTATNLAAKAVAADSSSYNATNKEFYLSSDEIFFIRPGLDIAVVDFVIGDDLRPTVTFSLQDPGGLPLDIEGVFTPGPVDMRYYLTYIPMGEEFKVRYTESTRDRDGDLTVLEDGMYTYKFATVLPADYQQDATHTLGLVGRRDLQEFNLDRYVDNVVHNFVPSGNGDPVPRDIVTTETCNGRCHDPLAEHGGRYREIGICTQCHNPQLVGRRDGLSKDFNVIIHKVHKELGAGYPAPINACETCHTGGTPTEAFPMVANPNPVPVCDGSRKGVAEIGWNDIGPLQIRIGGADGKVFVSTKTGAGTKDTGKWVKNGMEFFMLDRDSGAVVQDFALNTTVLGCVGNAPHTARGIAGAQHTNWLDHPSRKVCGSCHTDVDFATGEGHSELELSQVDDELCSVCHIPDSGVEFDRSIRGAHKARDADWGGLARSAQFPGVLLKFIGIEDTDPGDFPTVTYSLSSRDGALKPASLNRLLFSISGPNEDFTVWYQEDVRSGSKAVGGNWTYTFKTPIPLDAMGSFTLGVEGREQFLLDMGPEESTERNPLEGITLEFAVTDTTAVARRMIVDDALCENCHTNLIFHGDNRTNANYCVTCHSPNRTDVARRPADEMPAESIHFKTMIHGIHRGEDRENGLVIYGYGNRKHDFGHVVFPGDLRNCENCHLPGTYLLPLAAGAAPTPDLDGLVDPLLPVTAACVSCHDSDSTLVHAFSNTAFFGEACDTCHAQGAEFDVEKVHAR